MARVADDGDTWEILLQRVMSCKNVASSTRVGSKNP
jgi:hypothetical protein